MKEIRLTNSFFAIVDDEDYDTLRQYRWWAKTDSLCNKVYAARTCRGGGYMSMHRQILKLAKSDPHYTTCVDHIDGNGLNNRKKNLHVVTRSENQHNSGMRINNSSGRKGVTWDATRKRWLARGMLNRKQCNLYQGSSYMVACAARKVWEMNNGR